MHLDAKDILVLVSLFVGFFTLAGFFWKIVRSQTVIELTLMEMVPLVKSHQTKIQDHELKWAEQKVREEERRQHPTGPYHRPT